MKILNKLSKKNLLLNKKRSIGTLIGIILSVALICATVGLFISFRTALIESAIASRGNYHIALYNESEEKLKVLKNNRDVARIDILYDIGYSKFLDATEDRPYIHLYSYQDTKSFSNLAIQLVDGAYPKDKNELLISEELYLMNKDKYAIGNTITLNVGQRKTLDNYIMTKENPKTEEEVIADSFEMTFVITGIMERDYELDPYGDPGISALTVDLDNQEITNQDSIFYIRIQKPTDYEKTFSEILGKTFNSNSENATEEYSLNTELLRWQALRFDSRTTSMLYSVMIVVLAIIVGTSIFCIKNSFDISVTEKKKSYGMLASAGATKKQIRKSVVTESFMLGMIGIPLGILSGYLAVFILVGLVNSLIGDFINNEITFKFSVSLLPVVLSIILGFVTIYLSSISAAKKASRVSPIDLIRNREDVKINKKKLKTPFWVKKIFHVGGVIAYKNLKRSKKKYRTTVISLTVSIFVFISMNSFLYYTFKTSNTYYQDLDYNVMVNSSFDDAKKIEDVLKLSGTNDYTMLYQSNLATENGYLEINDLSKLTSYGKRILKEGLKNYGCYSDDVEIRNSEYCKEVTRMNIVAMNDKAFKDYAKKLGLSEEQVKNKGILNNNYKTITADGTRVEKGIYNYKENDMIKGTYNNKPLEFDVAFVTDIRPEGLEDFYSSDGFLIISEKDFHEIGFTPYILTINAKDPSEVVLNIENEIPEVSAVNIEENVQSEKSVALLTSVFLYGFLTVITLIGITNIFNTITSNLELRQKEFAMLKSIGMTKSEFNKMINLETLFYCCKSLLFGIVFGTIGSYLVYYAYAKKMDYGYYFPLSATVIAIISVFILVFIIMKYSMNKINKQNIIETIRKDNI